MGYLHETTVKEKPEQYPVRYWVKILKDGREIDRFNVRADTHSAIGGWIVADIKGDVSEEMQKRSYAFETVCIVTDSKYGSDFKMAFEAVLPVFEYKPRHQSKRKVK
jgi:hypothetical protein